MNTITSKPSGTMRAEMSLDGVTWQPVVLRPAQLPVRPERMASGGQR